MSALEGVIRREDTNSQIRVLVWPWMVTDILGGRIPRRVACDHVLAWLLIDADIVDMHHSREFQICEEDLRP